MRAFESALSAGRQGGAAPRFAWLAAAVEWSLPLRALACTRCLCTSQTPTIWVRAPLRWQAFWPPPCVAGGPPTFSCCHQVHRRTGARGQQTGRPQGGGSAMAGGGSSGGGSSGPTGLRLLFWLGIAILAHVLVALFGVLNRWLQVSHPLIGRGSPANGCHQTAQPVGLSQAALVLACPLSPRRWIPAHPCPPCGWQ